MATVKRFGTDVSSVTLSQSKSDEGLTLETSAPKSVYGGNLYYQRS